jgi:hypothetical protein
MSLFSNLNKLLSLNYEIKRYKSLSFCVMWYSQVSNLRSLCPHFNSTPAIWNYILIKSEEDLIWGCSTEHRYSRLWLFHKALGKVNRTLDVIDSKTTVWIWWKAGQLSGRDREQDNCLNAIESRSTVWMWSTARQLSGRDRKQDNYLDVIDSTTTVWMWSKTGQLSGRDREQNNCLDVIDSRTTVWTWSKTGQLSGRDRQHDNCLDVIENRTTVWTWLKTGQLSGRDREQNKSGCDR